MAAKIVMFVHNAGASGMIEEKNESTKVLTIVNKGTCGSSGTADDSGDATNGSVSFACCSAPASLASAFSAFS